MSGAGVRPSTARSISARDVSPPLPRAIHSSKSDRKRHQLLALEHEPGRLPKCPQPRGSETRPVRRVAQALDLLVPGRDGGILRGHVVGQDDGPGGPHDPGQLGDDAAGRGDVVQAEPGDRAVEA